MKTPPKAKLICDPKKDFIYDDLEKIFTLSGLLLLNIEKRENHVELEFTKGNRLTKKILIKLFKQLKKHYKVSEISITKGSWHEFEKFAEEMPLLHSGSNVRSYLTVEDQLVTKTYLKPKPHLDNEILARKKIGHLQPVTPIVESGTDHITMPFLQAEFKWNNETFPSLFPLEIFDKIYEFVNEVYSSGYCLVDWNPDSFIYCNNKIYMVDFEYFYEHSSPDSYSISPDITGVGQEKKTAAEGVVTFNKEWAHVLGLNHEEYSNLNSRQKLRRQRIHYWTKLVPSYVNRQLNKIVKLLKNLIKYKLFFRGGTIRIRSRL